MSGQKVETTHKHRNIIDDILDLGLLVLMAVWYFTGIELDEKTLAAVGGAGASARVMLRRILMNLWGEKLGIEEPKSEPANPDDEKKDGEEEESDESGESA